MLGFTPSEEQQMLVDAVHRYAENDVRPTAHDADEGACVRPDVVQTGWEIGILPGNIPEDMGGFGESYSAVTGALAAEELAWGDLALALHLMTPALVALPVMLAGTDAQREEFMPLFLDETPPPVTAALIEPRITFDPARPATTATRSNGDYVLNGQKAYVPLAEGAAWLLVYAAEADRTSAFLVRGDAEGLAVGEREQLMGVRALETYPVTLEDVRVEAAYRLGGEDGASTPRLLAHSQVALGALAVGVMRAALEYAIDYAKEREQFGAPIATKQAIAFMLAECAIEVDAARLMVWEAAWRLDQDADDEALHAAYLAHRYAAQAAVQVADSAVQTLGGYGYIREYPVERWLRNARGFTTFHGLAMV